MEYFTTRPELSGTFGAVASTHWTASAVGMKLLEAGANAFDAVVATGFVLQIVEPHLNGPAGDATILVSRKDDLEPTVICGQGGAPAAATIERFNALKLDLIPGTGLLAACVPGAFGAWLTILRDWGTVSLRTALEPAIQYAKDGHPILGRAIDTIESVRDLFLSEWRTSAAVFLRNGSAPAPGSLFSNPTLANLYARIVKHSEAAGGTREAQIDAALAFWYEGPVAEAIDRFCRTTEALDVSGRRHHGLLTADDLREWRPKVERPISIDYRGHKIFKCGPWSQGPSLLQALRILEGYDFDDMDPAGPEFVHLVSETLKLVMADREAWYGDDPGVPLDMLLSRSYAGVRRTMIDGAASLELRPGSPEGRAPPAISPIRASSRNGSAISAVGGGEPTFGQIAQATARSVDFGVPPHADTQGDTCHVDVVDRWGNMVSATPSGGWLQSSPIIAELGFALGTRLQMFSLRPGHSNSLAPRKRPRTTLTPSMAFKDGRPYLVFGTPGGDQQEQWSLLLLLNHIDKGMPLQRAIDAPAFHTDHLVASFWPREISMGSLILESRYPESTVQELRRRGHFVEVGGPWSEGRLSACSWEVSGQSAILRAGANPRGMQGYAIVR
jgi:gamma-glutamyltranspeptidase / glutathione hydrolase